MKPPKIPEKPFRNFEEFMKQQRRLAWNHDLEYPCSVCGGRRGTRKIEDLDPVEGYKMAPLYPCTHCDKTGSEPNGEAYYWSDYRRRIAQWKRDRAEAVKLRATWLAGARKLTPKQRQVMDIEYDEPRHERRRYSPITPTRNAKTRENHSRR